MENIITLLKDILFQLTETNKEKKLTLDLEETVKLSGISRSRILEIVNTKGTDFPYFRNGKKLIVNRVMLEEWLRDKAKEHETV